MPKRHNNTPLPMVEASFTVLEKQQEPPAAGRFFRLDEDIEIRYHALRDLCMRQLEARDLDLLIVAGAVWFVDRNVKRRAACWSRILNVTIPVHEQEFWSAQENLLSDTLGYLTGDIWRFTFVPRQISDPQIGQQFFAGMLGGSYVVFPYSGGLDCFVASRLLDKLCQHSPFYVTIEMGASASHITGNNLLPGNPKHAGLPIRFKENKHPESSARTRSFMFFTVAALAAKMINATEVLIAENGQGAFGPALVPNGSEHPYVGTHPAFTRRFSKLVSAIYEGVDVRFHHPYAWKTKAEMLLALKEEKLATDWNKTVSCPRNLSRHKGPGSPAHCGVCSNCLLRRMAAYSANLVGIQDRQAYLWGDLLASKLDDSVRDYSPHRGTTDNDRNIALAGVLSHNHLANFAPDAEQSSDFAQTVHDAAQALSVPAEQAVPNLKRLLMQHRQEWQAFLSALPAHSWVRHYAGES